MATTEIKIIKEEVSANYSASGSGQPVSYTRTIWYIRR